MNSKRNVVNAVWVIAQQMLVNVIGVPAAAYIIRSLGPLQYGQWATAISLVAAAQAFCRLGLSTLFVRSIAQEPENAREALADQLGLRGLLGSLAGLSAILLGRSL